MKRRGGGAGRRQAVAWRNRRAASHPKIAMRPIDEATGLLSLLLGRSITVLLEETSPAETIVVLDAHLDRHVNSRRTVDTRSLRWPSEVPVMRSGRVGNPK